jgi:hypothetical protein
MPRRICRDNTDRVKQQRKSQLWRPSLLRSVDGARVLCLDAQPLDMAMPPTLYGNKPNLTRAMRRRLEYVGSAGQVAWHLPAPPQGHGSATARSAKAICAVIGRQEGLASSRTAYVGQPESAQPGARVMDAEAVKIIFAEVGGCGHAAPRPEAHGQVRDAPAGSRSARL